MWKRRFPTGGVSTTRVGESFTKRRPNAEADSPRKFGDGAARMAPIGEAANHVCFSRPISKPKYQHSFIRLFGGHRAGSFRRVAHNASDYACPGWCGCAGHLGHGMACKGSAASAQAAWALNPRSGKNVSKPRKITFPAQPK